MVPGCMHPGIFLLNSMPGTVSFRLLSGAASFPRSEKTPVVSRRLFPFFTPPARFLAAPLSRLFSVASTPLSILLRHRRNRLSGPDDAPAAFCAVNSRFFSLVPFFMHYFASLKQVFIVTKIDMGLEIGYSRKKHVCTLLPNRGHACNSRKYYFFSLTTPRSFIHGVHT